MCALATDFAPRCTRRNPKTTAVMRVCLPPSASCLAIEGNGGGLVSMGVSVVPVSKLPCFETPDMFSEKLGHAAQKKRKAPSGSMEKDSHATKPCPIS